MNLTITPLFPRLVAIGYTILISACGGGGGGDGSTSSGIAMPASTITAANANDVAAQGYAAAMSLGGQVDFGTGLVTAASDDATLPSGLIDTSLDYLYRALKKKPAAIVPTASGTDTLLCSGGGTMTVSYNLANVSVVSNGDTIWIMSSHCIEEGMMLDGGLSITFSNISGVPSSTSAWGATLSMTYHNLSISQSNVTETVNGDLALAYNRTVAGAESYSSSGSSLHVSIAKAGTTASRTLSAYSHSGSLTTTNLHTHRSNFTVSGAFPRLGSNVGYTIKTTKDFKQQGTAYPHDGIMTITATNNTSLTLTALSSTNAQIGIDRDGNGTIDETRIVTWLQLSSLL